MLESKRRNEIRNKAGNIIKASDRYHFIHATYACQLMIKEIVSQHYKEECRKLSQKIREKTKNGNEISEELMEEYNHLMIMAKEGRAHIDIDYIETSSEEEARVIKINNAFVINLPKSLAQRVTNEDGTFNKSAVSKIRNLMAHELGHIVLHTDELLKIEGLQGSIGITETDKEEEAGFFANEILQMRDERNRVLHSEVFDDKT